MAGESVFQARNPLQAKLDVRSFAQLTIWALLLFAAWKLAMWLWNKGTAALGQVTGKVSTSGSLNTFFSTE